MNYLGYLSLGCDGNIHNSVYIIHPKPFFTKKEKIGRQVLKNVY